MNKTNELITPALKAHMGDWIYYVTFLRMDQIESHIHIAQEIHTSNVLNDMIQRQITDRAVHIADYLLNQTQRFFNSLIVGVYSGSPEWYELSIGESPRIDTSALDTIPDGVLGILKLDGTQMLFAIDGQHRVAGIRQALEKDKNLRAEEVSTIFVSHRNDKEGMERTRRLFTTLNRYAKPVSKSEIVALDEDDVIAIVTRELVEKHSLFRDKVSLSKTKAIAVSDNSSFTTIITLYEVLDIVLRDKGQGWTDFKRRRPTDERIEVFYRRGAKFWNEMIELFPPLKELYQSQPEMDIAGRYRNREIGGNLLFRPVGLLIIAHVVRLAVESGISEVEALKRISTISVELSNEPWVGLLWDKTNKRMISGPTPQKVARQLLFHYIGGDLARMRTNVEDVTREYAGLLNKSEKEVSSLFRRITVG